MKIKQIIVLAPLVLNMFDYLEKKEPTQTLEGTVFEIKWNKDGNHMFAQVGPISVDYISRNSEGFWSTIRNNEKIASYRTIGGDWEPFVSKCIEKNGNFWHSKFANGDRGVEVIFKKRVAAENFKFQTRQQAGKFIEFIT